MHGLTGGNWKRGRNPRKPRQSPTLLDRDLTVRRRCCGGYVTGRTGAVVAADGAVVVYPGSDGVLAFLDVGGACVGEFAQLAAGGAGACLRPVCDLHLAGVPGGADGDGHGAGLVAGVTCA